MSLVKNKPKGKLVKAMPELNEDFCESCVQFSVEEKKKAELKESAIFESKEEPDYDTILHERKKTKAKINVGLNKNVKKGKKAK